MELYTTTVQVVFGKEIWRDGGGGCPNGGILRNRDRPPPQIKEQKHGFEKMEGCLHLCDSVQSQLSSQNKHKKHKFVFKHPSNQTEP